MYIKLINYIHMRLLFITPGFPADTADDTCIPPLQLLVRELVRQGDEVSVIALEYPFQSQPYLWEGARVYPCNGRNRPWLRWRSVLRARRFAREIMGKSKCDILHSFWLGPAWRLGEQLATRWEMPHLCTLMGQDVLAANRYLRTINDTHAKRLIALTPFHNEQLEQTTGWRAAHCIPWGIDPEEAPPALPAERPVDVLGVGSLLPVKNWERWLRVLRLVVAEQPGLCAELIGEGPEKLRLMALATQLGLEQVVRFRGGLTRAAVLARMRESRVLLHTARFESFGYVLAEAKAQGCRVVGTPVGIAPALADCAGSEEDLAAAVARAPRRATAPESTAAEHDNRHRGGL